MLRGKLGGGWMDGRREGGKVGAGWRKKLSWERDQTELRGKKLGFKVESGMERDESCHFATGPRSS